MPDGPSHERRWETRAAGDRISPLVFHTKGRAIGDTRKSWANACKEPGLVGKLFHDLRRSAVRDMTRAGVPQSVAMSVSGHKTVSVFNRYDIASVDDMRAALTKREEYSTRQPATVVPIRKAGSE